MESVGVPKLAPKIEGVALAKVGRRRCPCGVSVEWIEGKCGVDIGIKPSGGGIEAAAGGPCFDLPLPTLWPYYYFGRRDSLLLLEPVATVVKFVLDQWGVPAQP